MWLLKTQLRVTRAPIIIWNFISSSIIERKKIYSKILLQEIRIFILIFNLFFPVLATNKDEEFHATGHRSAFHTIGLIIKGIINSFRDTKYYSLRFIIMFANHCYRAWLLNSFVC